MKIEKDRVVRFHYAVAETGQEALETSKDAGEPLAILFGRGHIIPGLEKAMAGREAGESFKADVTAAEAYGERREGLGQRIPKKHFGNQKLVPGMQVTAEIITHQRRIIEYFFSPIKKQLQESIHER